MPASKVYSVRGFRPDNVQVNPPSVGLAVATLGAAPSRVYSSQASVGAFSCQIQLTVATVGRSSCISMSRVNAPRAGPSFPGCWDASSPQPATTCEHNKASVNNEESLGSATIRER